MMTYKLLRNVPLKICMAAVLAVTVTAAAFLLTLIFGLGSLGMYDKSQASFRNSVIEPLANSTAYEIMNDYIDYEYEAGDGEDTDVHNMTDADSDEGSTEESNTKESAPVPILSSGYDPADYPDYDFVITVNDKAVSDTHSPSTDYMCTGAAYGSYYGNHVTIKAYLKAGTVTNGKTAAVIKIIDTAYPMRYIMIGVSAALIVISVILFVLLMRGAGRREEDNEIHDRRFWDHIPGDLYLAAVAAAAAMMIFFALQISEANLGFGLIVFAAAGILCSLISLACLMSAAVQHKQRRLLKESMIGRVFKLIMLAISLVAAAIQSLPVTWKLVVPAAFLWIVLMFTALVTNEFAIEFIVFIIATLILALSVYTALMLRRLEKGAQIIASGDTSHIISTEKMYGAFRRHAENLNSINKAVDSAVAERMKSERFKTELITNVSHDIKTPLTSIINYTDLLAAEDLQNEKAAEYIDIISRNAARLKKLTSDIVEASKASTGNIKVTISDCNMGIILNQALGEYDEKMRRQNLTPVVSLPEDDITVLADGEHTWRIIDNIMNNICKYAQPGTRVYMDAYEKDSKAYLSFKNISAVQLNITADELMERFVRGDASRNTEGSGLGLSIAQNLAELQGGHLELSIDGDLFKVTVEFCKS